MTDQRKYTYNPDPIYLSNN